MITNPSREGKHQQELLKDYFNHVGALASQEMCHQQPWGRKLASISLFQDYYHSFQDKTSYSKNFYLSWCSLNLQQFSIGNPNHL